MPSINCCMVSPSENRSGLMLTVASNWFPFPKISRCYSYLAIIECCALDNGKILDYPYIALGLAEPLDARAGYEHILLKSDVASARHLGSKLQGEYVADLRRSIGRLAITLPPGAEKRRAVVGHPAEVVSQCVLVLGVACLDEESPGR